MDVHSLLRLLISRRIDSLQNTRLNVTALSIGESCKQLSLLFLVIIIQEYRMNKLTDRTEETRNRHDSISVSSVMIPDTVLHYHSHVNKYTSISFFDILMHQ